MSTDTLYIIMAILVFPALWLFAWFLDRIWPGMSERRKTEASRDHNAEKALKARNEPRRPGLSNVESPRGIAH